MKKIFLALACALVWHFSPGQATHQGRVFDAHGNQIKVGTYDSRAVAYAYVHSDLFKEEQRKLGPERDAVMKTNDTAKWKETMIKVCTEQYLLHQRFFGVGSTASILRKIETKLPAVAKNAGVTIIVSKWEINWVDPNVSYVDLTDSIAQLFTPLDKLDKTYSQVKQIDKTEVDEIDVGEVIEMWQMFEAKYLGKKPS